MNKCKFIMFFLFLFVSQIIFSQEQQKKWDLATCIKYAMEQNIQIKKSKIAFDESKEDTKTARAAMFPSLSFSSSHSLVTTPLNNTGNFSFSHDL